MIMELVPRDLIKKLESSETWQGIWTTSCCPAICYADDVVLAAASVAAAEVIVAEVIAKIERSGFDSWRRENTLDNPTEDDGHKH